MMKLSSDRGVTVHVTEYTLETYIRKVLKWRTATGYKSMIDRFMVTGSTKYNAVINALSIDGY